MKALTFSVIVALIWHAWVGVRVWYDYAKPAGLRLVLQALSAIWLVSYGGWPCRCCGACEHVHP